MQCCDETQLNELAASHGDDLRKLAVANDFYNKVHSRALKSEAALTAAIHMAQRLKSASAGATANQNGATLLGSVSSEALEDFSGMLTAGKSGNDRLKMFGEMEPPPASGQLAPSGNGHSACSLWCAP
ncbi:MAG: hypothetical protein LBI39_02430 [Puniceicoccales bacterium]|nr:hypothetical protein [Puniceicoccales bacterium]